MEPGGALGLFVPAMPSLYGSLDYKSGHYRRYTPRQLADLVADAGFVDVSVRYLDPIGVVPYWSMYTLLDVDRLDTLSSRGYDRVLVPIGRALERVVQRATIRQEPGRHRPPPGVNGGATRRVVWRPGCRPG